MSNILGLDLGTNSIGWALVNEDKIKGIGSRIIPMDQAELGDFNNGNLQTKTSQRTFFRGVRRLYNRDNLRRERIHRVLRIMGFLPTHYSIMLDRYGKFIDHSEPKLSFDKGNFIFEESFNQMINDFKACQSQILINKSGERCKIPHDWTIYFLRKKALTEKITKEELAWIILNFNQKRGYYQLRGEDNEAEAKTAKQRKEFICDSIRSITDTGQIFKQLKVINVELESGLVGKIFKREVPEWTNLRKNIIATFDIDKEGNDKIGTDGVVSCRFAIPTDDEWDKEWKLIKLKTERDLKDSNKSVGSYIYDTLLANPYVKIRGKLVRTIERNFYKDELEKILIKQTEFHAELQDNTLLNNCIHELYEHNEPHANELRIKDFTNLFIRDIIFYQRPLKSKKSLISNCRYEYTEYMDKYGVRQKKYLKCIHKSHPIYQEFRVIQWLQNLRIIEREREGKLDVDVTSCFIKDKSDKQQLLNWLMSLKEITQEALLKYPDFGIKKADLKKFRWNYVEDKSYPMNETRSLLLKAVNENELTRHVELQLWHLLYSISDKKELEKALEKFKNNHGLNDEFLEKAIKFPPFKNDYGTYSEKAIKKLLSLMRLESDTPIDLTTKTRIEKIINGEFSDDITTISREKLNNLKDIEDYHGLPLWLACYAVYGYHSEQLDTDKWSSPDDINRFLSEFKQHSLRNSTVEKIVTETLKVVRDIWREHGELSEIHVELGREMKNPADKRKAITTQQSENENSNLRLKLLLSELASAGDVEGVRNFSPNQLEILKIYENGVLTGEKDLPDDILKISKLASPSKSDLAKYRLWLEQKYRSPYTGVVIPLGKLFTTAYQIEHIIPKARYYDDSLSNKVICEAAVNGEKGKMLPMEFISENGGKIIDGVKLFTKEAYEHFVKEKYSGNRSKMKKLLLEEIPEDFITRQLNDTRYISKYIKGLLSNIVRGADELNAPTSKNLLSVTGGITTILKQEWGLNDIWNDIIYPRFERLNQMLGEEQFGRWENKGGKRIFQISMPIELQKGFNKKRIDHRHHALDALVIAVATRNHINYLNNSNAADSRSKERYDMKMSISERDSSGKLRYSKPWKTFTQDTRKAIQEIIVSFKYQQRIINKTVNHTEKWILNEQNGRYEKKKVKQEGENWAIRQSLHKETVKGRVNLKLTKYVMLSVALSNYEMIVNRELKNYVRSQIALGLDAKQILKSFKDNEYKHDGQEVKKVEIYYFDDNFAASRVAINDSFDTKKIEQITDRGIQKILLKHLELGGNFTDEGIEQMNRDIKILNGGKDHKPIVKVRISESMGNKFAVGTRGTKSTKFVEAAKGTNLFFAIYVNEEGIRSYESIPLNIVTEHMKQNLSAVPEISGNKKLRMVLSPGDLVYVPTIDEIETGVINEKIDTRRIYKMMSCTKGECHFIPYFVSSPIIDTKELGSNNKSERAWSGEQIKSICIKLSVDRLGVITNIPRL